MTTLTILALLCAVVAALAIFGSVIAVALDHTRFRNNQLAEYMRDEHTRNLETGRLLVTMTETFGYRLQDAALRESADIRVLLDASVGHRDRLLTALIALNPDPRAAQRFGIVERDLTRATNGDDRVLREFMDQARHSDDLVDENGQPIIPLGFPGG